MEAQYKKRLTEWAEALESGEYVQGRATLTYVSPDGLKQYCCLGVLCELAVKAGVPINVETHRVADEVASAHTINEYGWSSDGAVVLYDDDWNFGPDAVYDYVGLRNSTFDDNSPRAFAYANDQGESFASIAAAIRNRYGL